jgi:hypothetical protein
MANSISQDRPGRVSRRAARPDKSLAFLPDQDGQGRVPKCCRGADRPRQERVRRGTRQSGRLHTRGKLQRTNTRGLLTRRCALPDCYLGATVPGTYPVLYPGSSTRGIAGLMLVHAPEERPEHCQASATRCMVRDADFTFTVGSCFHLRGHRKSPAGSRRSTDSARAATASISASERTHSALGTQPEDRDGCPLRPGIGTSPPPTNTPAP